MNVPFLSNPASASLAALGQYDQIVHLVAQSYYDDDSYEEDNYGNYYDQSSTRNAKRSRSSDSKRGRQPTFLPTGDRGGLFGKPKQIGAALVSLGCLLTLMGVMLFFEGNLLRLGNVLVVLGTPLLIGLDRTRAFFMKKERLNATIITALGIATVILGKPRIGILLEVFGLMNLVGNMFPIVLAVAKRIPIVGDVLNAFSSGKSKGRYRNQF